MMPTLFSAKTQTEQPDLIAGQINEGLKQPAESLIAFYNAMINRENRAELLPAANFPILWVMGNDDTVIPKEKTMQQTMLASVNFVEVYDNCGHMAMLEDDKRLVIDIMKFAKYCFDKN